MTDQNSQFFAVLTAIGKAKQANADALGVPWTFAQMGVGDANGTDPIPSEGQTQLINERRRAPLNQLKVDPANANVIIAEQVIPESVGGWWIREVGLYDAAGDLVAVANCAPSFKPLLSQGSGRTQVVRMNLIVSNTANVELKIDPSVVLATRAYVDGLTVRANQSEAEAGTENSKIMTPLRVFQAIAKVVKQATETVFGWAKVATQAQVTTGTDDTTFITPKKLRAAQAIQTEAEAGTDNRKIMTPLLVFQAIAKVVTQATEAAFGWAKIATQTQTNAGTDDATIITPKKLRMGFSASLTVNGYIALPSWMGGLIIQWVGYGGSLGAGSSTVINFPIAFPNGVFRVAATPVNVTQNGTIPVCVAPDFTAGIDLKVGLTVRNLSTQTTQVNLLAIGN